MSFFLDENPPRFEVPSSKSILLRTLLLAALSEEEVEIILNGAFCEDTRAMISCLKTLGVKIDERGSALLVHGCGGTFPDRNVRLEVKESAATARFLSAALALCGGDALFSASGTLVKRPMDFGILERAGATITRETENPFPFRISSGRTKERNFAVDTTVSTQFASAILLCAANLGSPFTVRLTGNFGKSGYLQMTLSLMRAFGICFSEEENLIEITSKGRAPTKISSEADLSAASYFCSLALLKAKKIFLKDVKRSALQPDDAFLTLLEERGLILREYENGLLAEGTKSGFQGFDCDFSGFSDQAITAAVLAPFADTPSFLRGFHHLRLQESDRIQAICENLRRLGAAYREEEWGLKIFPSSVRPATIEPYGDHRIAMAFALAGARTHVTIKDPGCCRKTFENYFEQVIRSELLDIGFD